MLPVVNINHRNVYYILESLSHVVKIQQHSQRRRGVPVPVARLRQNEEIRAAVPECAEARQARERGAHSQVSRTYNTAVREEQVSILFFLPIFLPVYMMCE